jgi:glycosyltransferase involved in cell wall biosynthesis
MSVKQSIKNYGIYLNYPPTVDMRAEGLGRYLASFLKGAAERDDIQFTIVCPSWSHTMLDELFASENVPKNFFTIKSPPKKPVILKFYEALLAKKRKLGQAGAWRRKLVLALNHVFCRLTQYTKRQLVQANSFAAILPAVLIISIAAIGLIALSPLLLLLAVGYVFARKGRSVMMRFLRPFSPLYARLRKIMSSSKDSSFVIELYDLMSQAEIERMFKIIRKLEVSAWYCPTAFWPEFNRIKAPRLMCIPDVVLSDFPVGFCQMGGNRFLGAFQRVKTAIQTAQHFVTYSEAIKQGTLVEQYAVPAQAVHVIHHAPNRLNLCITITGFADGEAATLHYSKMLLGSALRKSSVPAYTQGFQNNSVRFIFYASQFRPNKNILSLLRAYEYLLRRRYIPHKLFLTGNLRATPEVDTFIREHHLENDVLCLKGLTTSELAACYKLAEVAVNPSFSEGGCPFTFTEALSVKTPVVMARIPVTEEVLSQPELQDTMYFDPYDWQDMAARIEWAIHHQEELLALQLPVYEKLIERTWTDVVNEHIAVLEQISTQPVEHAA